MIEQKNRMDLATTEYQFLKSEVNFELLWRCISKIWNNRPKEKEVHEMQNTKTNIIK